jgi:hypothetical protein
LFFCFVFFPIFGTLHHKIYENHLQATFRDWSPLLTVKKDFLGLTIGWKLTAGRLPQVRGKTDFRLHNSAIFESI